MPRAMGAISDRVVREAPSAEVTFVQPVRTEYSKPRIEKVNPMDTCEIEFQACAETLMQNEV